jgi:hypothetical protein
MRSVLGIAACCALSAIACAGSGTKVASPEDTVIAFARDLNEGKLDAAYALMSDDYKKRVSLEAWKKQLSENPDDTNELSNTLSHVRGPSEQEAVLRYGDGEELRLRKSGERWLVVTDLVSFYDQSTPRAAVRAFARALSRRRYDVLMRLVPNADKEGMTTDRLQAAWSGEAREEVERMLASLQQHLEDPIEIVGNHATMPYGEHARVQMLREDGVWKIEDPE